MPTRFASLSSASTIQMGMSTLTRFVSVLPSTTTAESKSKNPVTSQPSVEQLFEIL